MTPTIGVVLTIDQGNSSTKYSLFDPDANIVGSMRTPAPDIEVIPALLAGYQLRGAIYASVARLDIRFIESLRCLTDEHLVVLTPTTPVPVRNAYSTPATLGVDRLAAAVGAATLYPGQASFIADLGSALTCDLISPDAEYMGGAIAPGVNMRLKALNNYTARLPLQHWDGLHRVTPFPTDTADALLAGAVFGVAAQIEYTYACAKKIFPDCRLLLTGGHSSCIEHYISHLRPTCLPALVDTGLNRIYHFNETNI